METKVNEVNLLTKIAKTAEAKGMYARALDYYRQAGEILVSLCLYLPLEEQKTKIKVRAEEVLKKGAAMKKLLRDEEFAKMQKSQGQVKTSQIKTEFMIVPECAVHYQKLGFEFYRQASDKNASGSRKLMLKSAINAHLAEIELKKTVTCSIEFS
jgi:hypothetical protein